MAGNVSSPGTTVTGRALALIGAFDEDHRRLTLTELGGPGRVAAADRAPPGRRAGRLGCARPRAATASTSSAGGCGTSACWRRSTRACVEVASPFLHDLYGATLATVHLAVRDGTEVLYLDRLRGPRLGAGA